MTKTKERIVCASLTIEISKSVFAYISSSLYSELTTQKTTPHVRFFFSLDFVQVASLIFLSVFVSRCTHNFQDKNISEICIELFR